MNTPHEEQMQKDLEKRWHQLSEYSPEARQFLSELHTLAEAQSPSALAVLKQMVHAQNEVLRGEAINLIGFHYDVAADTKLLEHVRYVVATDRVDEVRMEAAAFLGQQGQWPEQPLRDAVASDSDAAVRRIACEALLRLSGLDARLVYHFGNQMRAGTLEPSLGLVADVLQAEGHVPSGSKAQTAPE